MFCYVFKIGKGKCFKKISCLETSLFLRNLDTKEIMLPERRPKSFWSFEKRTPASHTTRSVRSPPFVITFARYLDHRCSFLLPSNSRATSLTPVNAFFFTATLKHLERKIGLSSEFMILLTVSDSAAQLTLSTPGFQNTYCNCMAIDVLTLTSIT